MNDITKQTSIILFFMFLIVWKITDILAWVIIKLYCWNAGIFFLLLFYLMIFCIKYNAYKRKIETEK